MTKGMGKFKQKPETKRFIEIYTILIKDEVVKGQTDFVNQISKKSNKKIYSISSFNQILLGKRDVPTWVINLTCSVFHANRDFIFDNKEPKFIDPLKAEEEEKNEIEFLRELIKSQQKIIENLSKGNK